MVETPLQNDVQSSAQLWRLLHREEKYNYREKRLKKKSKKKQKKQRELYLILKMWQDDIKMDQDWQVGADTGLSLFMILQERIPKLKGDSCLTLTFYFWEPVCIHWELTMLKQAQKLSMCCG